MSCCLALLLPAAWAIHWPGFGHGEYGVGEVLPLRVAKLTSIHTQLPLSFYSLAQCTPQTLTASPENLGEVLHGDRILNAPFELRLRQPRFRALCRLSLNAQERAGWIARIGAEYRAHLLLDNLPVATRLPPRRAGGTRLDRGPEGPLYERGYRLGATDESGGVVVHNHLHFTVKYHITTPGPASGGMDEAPGGVPGGGGARIVGFEVVPSSRAYRYVCVH